MINTKKCLIVFVSAIILTSLAAIGTAYTYYIEDATVPQQQKLDVKNNLIVNPFTGAAVYTHPITMPQGTNQLQPSLTLFYNSQAMEQRPGILGTGWSLSENYIQRDTNYTIQNISDDEFILVLDGSSYDLVYSAVDKRFHTKIESFLNIQNVSGGNNEKGVYWRVRTTEGTSYQFGFYNFSELISNQGNYTWRWSLDLVNDTYNNSIFYNYSENPFSGDNGTVYLNSIEYNNDRSRKVNLYYQLTDRLNARTTYEYGNKIKQSRMLSEIDVNVSNALVKKYVFNYSVLDSNGGTLQSLSTITEYGNDSISSLSPTIFGYIAAANATKFSNWIFEGCNATRQEGCFVGGAGQDNGVRLVDLNGDGLVDVYEAQGGDPNPHVHTYFNNGTGWINSSWSFDGCRSGYQQSCFVNSLNHDLGVRLVDLNGDGLVDLLQAQAETPNPYVSAYFNNGTGWINSSWIFEGCNATRQEGCFVGGAGQDNGVRLVDLNGDGLVDVYEAQGGDPNPHVHTYFNNGTGWINSSWSFDGCRSGYQQSCFVNSLNHDLGVRLVDLNGDGLVDLLQAQAETPNPYVSAYFNNGTGWINSSWSFDGCRSGYQQSCLVNSLNQDIGTRLVDLNGDGLVDVFHVQGQTPNPNMYTYINNGTGWANNTWYYDGNSSGNISAAFIGESGADTGTRLVDLNGDGLVDIYRAQAQSPSAPVALSFLDNGVASYLLNKIDFSLGGGLSLSYQKSTSSNNTGNDSKNDLNFNLWLVFNVTKNNSVPGAQNTLSSTVYNFSNGLYDYGNKEFRGFNFASEQTGDALIYHRFHQDNGRVGKEYQTSEYDNQSNPYRISEQQWNTTVQNGYYLANLVQDSERTYNSTFGNPQIRNNTYTYDQFGNLVYKDSLGDVANANDDRFELYVYANNSNAWIVNKVINYSLIDSNNATILRNTLYSYDNLAFGVAPTKGDITRKEDSLSGGNAITLYGYSSFGNMVNSTDPNGKITKYAYGTQDTTNTFPDNMTNAKNQTTNYFYDLGTGNLLAEKDSNQFLKNYTYDSLAIQKTIVLPLDTLAFPTQNYSYNFTAGTVGSILVNQREQNGQTGTIDSYKFYDGFGRLIQTKVEAPNSQQIVLDIYYDPLGRISKQSNPYFIAASANYSMPNSTVAGTSFSYDVLNRLVRVTNPDNTFKNFSYNGWNVTVYDENGNRKDYALNAYGKITGIVERNGGEIYYTRYTYNSADELVFIKDALNNAFNYTYDSLGRKTSMIDPDLGTWTYQYDLNGNLIKQTDNLGQNVTFAYDNLNRKVNENSSTDNITYVYDFALNSTLTRIFSNSFVINYTYDNRSRKMSEQKTIDSITTTQNWTYDASDRVLTHTLPSGETVNFTYNEQGILSNIQGIANITYNEKNNPLGIVYNNTLVTNYTYFLDTFRLKQIKTSNKQALNYSYDPIGNVNGINDTIHNRNITMNYDSLNRLTYTQIADTQVTTLQFAYNAIGNMLNMTGTQNAFFAYAGSKPHAPSNVTFY